MEGLNFPTSPDWFNGAVVAIVITATAGILVKLAENKISGQRAISFITAIIFSAFIVALFWYNAVGFLYFLRAKSIEDERGCAMAMPTYEQAVTQNPKITGARERLISCSIALQRSYELIPILEPLSGVLATSCQYWIEMAQVYSANGESDQMLDAATRSAELYSTSDYDKMLDFIVRSAELDPLNSSWITSVGSSLHSNRQYAEAEAVLRIAVTHNYSDDEAVYWLAWALYEQGSEYKDKYEDALRHFEECIRRYKRRSENNLELGRCYAGKGFVFRDTGKKDQARAEFLRALQTYPNQSDVLDALDQLR